MKKMTLKWVNGNKQPPNIKHPSVAARSCSAEHAEMTAVLTPRRVCSGCDLICHEHVRVPERQE